MAPRPSMDLNLVVARTPIPAVGWTGIAEVNRIRMRSVQFRKLVTSPHIAHSGEMEPLQPLGGVARPLARLQSPMPAKAPARRVLPAPGYPGGALHALAVMSRLVRERVGPNLQINDNRISSLAAF